MSREPSVNPRFADLCRDPRALLAFGFGSGLAPVAPGTFGTLAALPFYALMTLLPLPAYLAVVVLALLVGVHLCGYTTRKLGVHDHGGIVWDEFVGLWIALIAVPPGLAWVLAGFVLFRFFDAVKPWPIRWADRRVHGGFGIMLDDVLAGAATAVCLQIAARLI